MKTVTLATNADDPALSLHNVRPVSAKQFECELQIRSHGFIADRTFWFERQDLEAFTKGLREMNGSLNGSAELRTFYEENGFRLDMEPRGQITVSGILTEYGVVKQSLCFGFLTDQTVLGPFIRDLQEVLNLPAGGEGA